MAGACQGDGDSTTDSGEVCITRSGTTCGYNRLMATFDIINPATSAVLDRAPDATVDDAKQAIEKSVAAFASWKAKTAFERSAILRKWYELILKDEDDARAHDDAGDGEAHHRIARRGEVRRGVRRVVRRGSEARLRRHRSDARRATSVCWSTRQPVGPVYAVTPWNFPAAMVTRKVAPALAAGCTVVLKPAEQSPLTAIRLEELWVKAGGPARCVPGRDDVRSGRVLRRVLRRCARAEADLHRQHRSRHEAVRRRPRAP